MSRSRLNFDLRTRVADHRSLLVAMAAIVMAMFFVANADAETVTLTKGGEQKFVVPSGVYELKGVTLIGGAGGAGGGTEGGTGGRGAEISGSTLTVIPGTTLYLEVGADGSQGSVAKGGFGSGAGSGGTATGICKTSGCSGTTSVLLMAGAGGGGGTAGSGNGKNGTGGNGGNAGGSANGEGSNGGNGGNAGAGNNLGVASGGRGGAPGHTGNGGSNGTAGNGSCGGGQANIPGGAGSGLNGGDGAGPGYPYTGGGGGGGGGYQGGGGGGVGAYATCNPEIFGGGGGGGAGGSLLAGGGTLVTATAGATPSLSFEYTPGPTRAKTIEVETEEPTLEVGPFHQMTVTATVKDVDGNGVPGDAVSFTSEPSVSISPVTDNLDGTYTATIQSSTKAGTVKVTATDSSADPAISDDTSFREIAGPAYAVDLVLSPPSIVADGASTSTATATVVDYYDNPIESGGDTVVFLSSDPGQKFGPVTDKGTGAYETTITSSTTAGTSTIGVEDETEELFDEEELTQTAASAASLGLGLTKTSVPADGASTTTAIATLTDAYGNPVPGATVSFASSDPGQKVSDVRSRGDGTYLATITASTTAGPATITAKAEGSGVVGTTVLTSNPGPPTALNVSLAPDSLVADGSTKTVATVRITDAYGNLERGSTDPVTLTSSNPGEAIGPVTNNGDGTYTATITASRTPGASTVTATDTARSLSGTATLTSSAVPPAPPAQPAPPQGGGQGTGPANSGGQTSGSGGGTRGAEGAPSGADGGSGEIKSISLGTKQVAPGRPVGLELTLDSPSTIDVVLERLVPGSGKGKGKSRFVKLYSVVFHGNEGTTTYRLATWFHHRKLSPGTYRVTATAGGTVRRQTFQVTEEA